MKKIFGTIASLAVTLLLVSGVNASPASVVLDSVNIGDTGSESGHNLNGWTDVWSGCGWCGPDTNMRLIWGEGGTCAALLNLLSS